MISERRNTYKLKDPCVISFSGGRTSGYMLWNILKAYGGSLPEHIKVAFANTGKEMPQTLDFVRDCADNWGVDITWLECVTRRGREDEKKKYYYEYKVVDYGSASRSGEPFSQLIKARRYAPNPVARFCTQELKILRIKAWGNDQFGHKDWDDIVGLRYDEPRRVAKMRGRKDILLPLATEKVTKEQVGDFWRKQNFDLDLPNNNGVTDWGNCDLCFLKGEYKKLSMIREKPEIADWWIKQEADLSDLVGKGASFRKESSYARMKLIATDQNTFDFMADDTDTIPCFCTD